MKNRTAAETEFFYTDKASGKTVSFRQVPDRYVVSYADDDKAVATEAAGAGSESVEEDVGRGYRVVNIGAASTEATLGGTLAESAQTPLNTIPALADEEGNERLVVPDEFAVQFARDVTPTNAEAVLATMDLAINKRFQTPGFFLVAVPEGRGLFETMRDLAQRDGVAFVEPSEFSVDDRLDAGDDVAAVEMTKLWGLSNTGQTVNGVTGSAGIDVKALDAWVETRGSPDVIICVLDTGCHTAHPDIAPNLLARPDNEDWNFVSSSSKDTTDPDGHGTHVCGTAAAAGNGTAIIGLAPKCKVMPLQVALMGSAADYQRRADAINLVARCARDNPGRRYVLNLSWRTAGDVTSIRLAVADALAAGVVVVVAAGNSGSDMDSSNNYPASYAGVITVAALDATGKKASFSNYGARIDISAPGVNIYSAVPQTSHKFKNGTSMAAPHVTAAAALVLSRRPAAPVDEIKRILRDSATPVDGLNTLYAGKIGTGLLNAAAAVLDVKTS